MRWPWRQQKQDAPPLKTDDLVAFYWTGDAPTARPLTNITEQGFYMVTEHRWRPGTLLTLALQRDVVGTQNAPPPHLVVVARVTGEGEDGVHCRFVPMSEGGEDRLGKAASKRGIMLFLARYTRNPHPSQQEAAKEASRLGWIRGESGQVAIFTALSMTCLFGTIAFAADVGLMLHQRRLVQTAADTAAVAGATELAYGNAVSAATAAATLNHFTSGVNGATVTVNVPPASGPHAGSASYVEVIITQPQPTLFMKFFNIASMNVKARAVATNAGVAQGCVIITNPTAPSALELQGSFDVSAPSCGVIVDSNASNALTFTGQGGTLTAGSVGVTGGTSGAVSDSTPAPVTGIVPVSDPLQSIPAPNYTLSSCTTLPTTSTISPSCYNGSGKNNTIALNNVTLNPGVYVMNGNVAFSGTVTGNGVTLYLLGGLDASNGTLDLVAPTSGTYKGIVFFSSRTNTSSLTFDKGSASGLIEGIIYAPDSPMILHDSGGDTSGGLQLITDLIVNTLYDQTATLSITSYSQTTGSGPLTRVALVE